MERSKGFITFDVKVQIGVTFPPGPPANESEAKNREIAKEWATLQARQYTELIRENMNFLFQQSRIWRN